MRLWTDFNYMEDEDRVWADLDKAEYYFEQDLVPGQRAELFDGLGYECRGIILAVDFVNRMVELELDWATWRSTRDPRRAFDYSAGRDARFATHDVGHWCCKYIIAQPEEKPDAS